MPRPAAVWFSSCYLSHSVPPTVEYDFQFRLFESEKKNPCNQIFLHLIYGKNVRYFDVGCTAEGCGFDRYPRPNKHVFQQFDWSHTEAASGCHALCSYITRHGAYVLGKGPPIGMLGCRRGRGKIDRRELPLYLLLDSLRVAQYIFYLRE